jgi:hypothetical protein
MSPLTPEERAELKAMQKGQGDSAYERRLYTPREQHPAPSTWSEPHRMSRCKVALSILGLLLAILLVCAGVDAFVAARVVS